MFFRSYKQKFFYKNLFTKNTWQKYMEEYYFNKSTEINAPPQVT